MAESNITLSTDLYFPGEGSANWDFIGISFNGYHFPSKELEGVKIYRVSDGNRYNENLVGAFQDTTVQVPGGDGLYYFRTNYSNYPFNIGVAFDNLDETGFRKLRRIFNGKAMGPLIFDERPYKAYSVKVQSPPQFKYICFNESYFETETQTTTVNGEEVEVEVEVEKFKRIYKGDGTINFISYFPYASSVYKYLNLYSNENYPTKDEWAVSSGMLDSAGSGDNAYDRTNFASIKVYNPGDVDTDCVIRIGLPAAPQTLSGRTICLYQGSSDTGTPKKILTLDTIAAKGQDNFIRINSRTNLIEGEYLASGATKGTITGNLYNEAITSGDFFKIPICESQQDFYTITTSDGTIASIEYNYLYY